MVIMKNFIKNIIIMLVTVCITLCSTVACSIQFYPSSSKQTVLEFTLTSEDVANYSAIAEQAKESLITTSNMLTASKHVNNLVNGLNYIYEQHSIAQLLYFKDMQNVSLKIT